MAVVDVTMYKRNSTWTVIADATAGSTVENSNEIIVDIGGTDYVFNPHSRVPNGDGYQLKKLGDVYYMRITT